MADILKTATEGIEAIHLLVAERDNLRARVEILETDMALLQQKLDFTQRSLATSVAERDHYMRYCVELTTQLTTIHSVITDSIEAAKQSAYRRNNPAKSLEKQEEFSREEQKRVEALGRILGANNGSVN